MNSGTQNPYYWMADRVYRFSGYTFTPAESLLVNAEGDVIELEPRLVKLLTLFCEHPQTLLGKDQLLQDVWAPRVVSEESITVAVSQLRKHLGQTTSDTFIKTISGSGYYWAPMTERVQLGAQRQPKRMWWFGAVAAGTAITFLLMVGLVNKEHAPAESLVSQAQQLLPDAPDDAIRLFRRALTEGPDAQAYLGLVQAKLVKLPVAELKEHRQELASLLERARELNRELPQLHWVTAQVYFYAFWDFSQAYTELNLAFTHEEHTPEFLLSYAEMMLAMGETALVSNSITVLRRAFPEFYAIPTVAWLHLMMGDLDSARAEVNRILAGDAHTYGVHVSAQLIGLSAGDEHMAWSHLYALMKLASVSDEALQRYEVIYQEQGLTEVHRALLLESPSHRLGHYRPPLSLARHALIAGETEQAISYLEEALAQQQIEMLWFGVDPLYNALADHPGYLSLLQQFRSLVRSP
ncbi:winged helix-turn-helix domain-containing protein [Aliidiomarina indica]|uniref:winged helix-turn-helix domain-containing protein n=1 Tax=Aliidiomarina indica TaxID=2749147 RepID=UPI00188EF4BB|nr:winged helix-turn-helix domain-containing protein [Aliidiomarina indica]